jgi:hypothetical protein
MLQIYNIWKNIEMVYKNDKEKLLCSLFEYRSKKYIGFLNLRKI